MRSLVGTITTLLIALLASWWPAGSGAAEPSAPSLSIQEARKLSDTELSDRLATMLVQMVVDLDRPPLSDAALTSIGFALRPSTGWRGLCEAQLVQFGFQEGLEHPEERQSLKSLRQTTRYKIRGNPDQNGTEDEAQLGTRCAEDHPFKDGYFTAPDGRMAQNAGFVVLNAQAQARSGRLPFAIGCMPKDVCKTALSRISASSTDRILMVSEMDHCRRGRVCIEIAFFGSDLCYEVWSVTGRYSAPPGKEWGMIVPDRIDLHAECPGPLL